MSDHQSDRVFQAINGAELADIIANEIKRACLVDAHFRAVDRAAVVRIEPNPVAQCKDRSEAKIKAGIMRGTGQVADRIGCLHQAGG